MRIAFLCPYAWDRPGGVQAHIGGLGGALAERGHDVLVLAPTSNAHPRSNGLEIAIVGRTVPVPANGSVAPIALSPLVAGRVRGALKEWKPDVVHAHEPLIPGVSLYGLLSIDYPMVGTFHASAEASLGYRLGAPILHRAIKRLSVRTAVSEAARALIARYFPGEYALTPNGIEFERFDSAQPEDLGGDKIVLFFGRIERRKGLEVLIQAMTRLRGTARLVVAGDGPQRKSCEQLARDVHIDAQFLGRVPEPVKAGLFKRADVFCAPGLGGESFGIVLLEAMASGTPVVCSDIPGFKAVAGAAAASAPPGHDGELADAIRTALHEDDARRMTKMGRQIARSFDWSRLVAGVEERYGEAVT